MADAGVNGTGTSLVYLSADEREFLQSMRRLPPDRRRMVSVLVHMQALVSTTLRELEAGAENIHIG